MTGPYCAQCGQRTPHTDLTLREFLKEASLFVVSLGMLAYAIAMM